MAPSCSALEWRVGFPDMFGVTSRHGSPFAATPFESPGLVNDRVPERLAVLSGVEAGEVSDWLLEALPEHNCGPSWVFPHRLSRSDVLRGLRRADPGVAETVRSALLASASDAHWWSRLAAASVARWGSRLFARRSLFRVSKVTDPRRHVFDAAVRMDQWESDAWDRFRVPSARHDADAVRLWVDLEDRGSLLLWSRFGAVLWEALGEDVASWQLLFELFGDGVGADEALETVLAAR